LDYKFICFSFATSISLQDHIRKRRKEDVEDMMLFLFPVLSLMERRKGGSKEEVSYITRNERD
jgi:hypothetical protein